MLRSEVEVRRRGFITKNLMSLSEARKAIPTHLPWGTEWLASWSSHNSSKLRSPQGYAWQSNRDSGGMSLELCGASSTILAGLACSASCNLFFSGELYNRPELCSDLGLSADCRDAELVLSAWNTWGPDAFGRIDGLFSIVAQVVDQERLWAARDPMDHQPLFFAKVDHGFVFSENIALLLQHPSISREINRLKLAQKSFGHQGELHETFYNFVYRVPPAHHLSATKESWTLKQYWFLPE